MTIRPGEFWLADILFTDRSASKKRPVLVLWLEDQDAVVATVTSARPRTVTDIVLNDWSKSGLRFVSTVRLSRLDCLEQSLLLVRMGQVSATDAQRLKTAWAKHIKPQF
jgi:mRNA interferase MazF